MNTAERGSGSSLEGEPGPVSVLCIHTASQPPLGADTWVHANIVGSLDKSSHRIRVALVPERDGQPTPTAEIFAGIDGIERLSADLGNEGATAGGIAGLRGR
ncbi:MAG: hypothetical protein AAFO29_20260, partial [Actinomycetota bacterium]